MIWGYPYFWKHPCVVYLTLYTVLYIPGGAGFLPSTASRATQRKILAAFAPSFWVPVVAGFLTPRHLFGPRFHQIQYLPETNIFAPEDGLVGSFFISFGVFSRANYVCFRGGFWFMLGNSWKPIAILNWWLAVWASNQNEHWNKPWLFRVYRGFYYP